MRRPPKILTSGGDSCKRLIGLQLEPLSRSCTSMKSMKFKRWADRGVSSVVLMAIVATYSMVSLAASSKPVGELSFSGNSAEASVTATGEAANRGRTPYGDSNDMTAQG